MPLVAGSRLGTYEIVDLLGAGGMGDASLAGPGLVSWTPDGRTFAALFQRRAITVYLVEGLK